MTTFNQQGQTIKGAQFNAGGQFNQDPSPTSISFSLNGDGTVTITENGGAHTLDKLALENLINNVLKPENYKNQQVYEQHIWKFKKALSLLNN